MQSFVKIGCCSTQDVKFALIAAMIAAAYSSILAEQLGFAIIAQLFWVLSQVNLIEPSLEGIKFIGMQLAILCIIVVAIKQFDAISKNEN